MKQCEPEKIIDAGHGAELFTQVPRILYAPVSVEYSKHWQTQMFFAHCPLSESGECPPTANAKIKPLEKSARK